MGQITGTHIRDAETPITISKFNGLITKYTFYSATAHRYDCIVRNSVRNFQGDGFFCCREDGDRYAVHFDLSLLGSQIVQ
ncbi:hypothetical protein SDC9_158799 [bioreactor metagenome]|uniref:Uncharacterized protein n=1 Tax=bioreactor metagenome TaxID=1076179 RepID=A0A645FCX3_9ZZZZ